METKRIYKIEPVFEQRIWGTQRLRERYQYQTELENIAEVYNVCAMAGHLDNVVTGTGMRLSEFYRVHRELFGNCERREMPVEVCMAHSDSYLSIQLHPDDEYALANEGTRGRPEGWVIIEGAESNPVELGHKAVSLEQFEKLTENKEWDKLFRYIDMKIGQYVHVPAGSLHAFCKDAIAVAFSTNADVTYRLYDFDRIDSATGKPRELHIKKVLDNITVPDNQIDSFWPETKQQGGCRVTEFYDEAGVYTSGRIETNGGGRVNAEEFRFYVCADGHGKIGDAEIKAGETVFVPSGFGELELAGNMDLMYITYHD